MENSKDLFIKAFMEAEQISNAEFMNTENKNITFSKEFERKMDKLIKKDKRIHFSVRQKITKGLIAAIIAIIVAFTGLMSVSATRAPFIEFIKKVFPQFNEVTLSAQSTLPVDSIETEYTLTDLPEGFEIETYQKDDFKVFTIWKDENNEEIVFSQKLLDTSFTVDNEHDYKELYINGCKSYYIEDDSGAFLRWTDGYYWFTINVSEKYKDEIMILQKNISKKV